MRFFFFVLYIGLLLEGVMNENFKVIIQVKYECDGKRRVCYGEIDENKLEKLKNLENLENLENFDLREENYILMKNDGEPYWKIKDSVFSIKKLYVESTIFERTRMKGLNRVDNNSNTGICS